MVLLPVAHFVEQDDCDLIRVGRHRIHPRIDAHDMAQTAEGIEAFIIIDEIDIRFVINGRVHSSNGMGQIGHHGRKLFIQVFIVIDAELFLITGHQSLAAFFGIIVIVQGFIDLCICGSTLDPGENGSHDIGMSLRHWHRRKRNPQSQESAKGC